MNPTLSIHLSSAQNKILRISPKPLVYYLGDLSPLLYEGVFGAFELRQVMSDREWIILKVKVYVSQFERVFTRD